ncbi:MAG: hypothetical protein A2087_14695 [Spirochaetes bacterium GWD1_61_31]|nr:MAG: hypothetical protein A2Y37_09365 [Spirochaetes bacterium GWB1_60_80]OHD29181.1 MAG: hypothetical protein A2004_05715 [Spirochaetes bacterium GWC1_61_12]OHD35024.1 MAG: hypothetical protein A2087_14695 [Spirochaetes bacterium GWD1_61_31]OHD44028.1 MAG: hypothetical protein A2Y35_01685 [Spirochaetes bacterium GWE1_60_18]OHD59063.1 MAG: hypothetical protein A2Y32_02405 [Spirochaetes bacterium GWF1_60_12]HBO39978.1 hypothetical protein [Spirochaetaceae bacterium]
MLKSRIRVFQHPVKLLLEINLGAVGGDAPRLKLFELAVDPASTVLDLLETLRAGQTAEDFPAYRHSCHHGSCGTCGALIGGRPALLCLTTVAMALDPADPSAAATVPAVLRLSPLPGATVVAGIAVHPGDLFASLPPGLDYLTTVDRVGKAALPADPTLAAGATPASAPAAAWPDERRTARLGVRFEACIECGLCRAACPVKAPFMGPAALAAFNCQRQKRPEQAAAWLALAAGPDGAGVCQRHLACSKVCPQAVYPAKHIQLLRNALAGAS